MRFRFIMSSVTLLIVFCSSAALGAGPTHKSFKNSFDGAAKWVGETCKLDTVVGSISMPNRGGQYDVHIWCRELDGEEPTSVEVDSVDVTFNAKVVGAVIGNPRVIPLGFYYSNDILKGSEQTGFFYLIY
ncbi:MAG: hypothetical protein AAGA44_12125 [Pseudomonadota bacterium]